MSSFSPNASLLLALMSALCLTLSAAGAAAQSAEPEAGSEAGAQGEDAGTGAYPEELAEDGSGERERFAESSGDHWGVPEALRLYEASEVAYDQGRYQEAAAFLLRVIELDPEAPELYYNIALVFEHLLEFDRALEFLDHYRQFDIGAEERRRVERMMVRIRGAQENMPPSPVTQTRTRVVVQRFGRADGLFWAMIGATVLFGAGAAVTGGLALNWYEGTQQFKLGRDGDLSDYAFWSSVADTLALSADILIGVTSAAALTALLLYVLRTHAEIEVREEVEEARSGDGEGVGEDQPRGSDETGPEARSSRRRDHRRETARRPLILLGLTSATIGWEF